MAPILGAAAVAGVKGGTVKAASLMKGAALSGTELKDLSKTTSRIEKVLGQMNSQLEKASPAFKQMTTVFQKANDLIWRPIGDLLSRFLRPMAIGFLKFAQFIYKIFGKGGGDAGSREDLEDRKKQLEHDLVSATITENDEWAKDIQAELDQLNIDLAGKVDFASVWSAAKIVFEEDIPGLFSKMGEGASSLADTIGERFLEEINWFVDGINESKQDISDFFSVLGEKWDEAIAGVKTRWGQFAEDAKESFNNIKDFFLVTVPGWFQEMMSKFRDQWDRIKNLGSRVRGSVAETAGNIWESVKGTVGGFFGRKTSYATGGTIPQTGMYKLHAGEVVTRAGERDNSGSSFNITNHFHFGNVNVSNDMDIQTIARKLSEMQEVEIRRRVSYI